ncbi:DUF3389 domain-containing protein [Vibrio ziniensis]|uniref:DUF3389 domain-containing protein n=1 Tax=Vibrio ziniensis TaxID=2711221 RepID=A0A6G7CQ70_9VIBR|nr:DUF3389 domain-containing protein [Vibrio ziniensis]QIH44203.1 DUF3389 domain-containing protein [Vibrio ziniensis]
MVIEFEYGKIIATQHEVVIRLEGEHRATMQAAADAVQLMGKGANVVVVNCSEAKWSIKLDNETQLRQLSQILGCSIH